MKPASSGRSGSWGDFSRNKYYITIMKRLLPFLLLWLSSCASFVSYTKAPETTYYSVGNSWAFPSPSGKPVYRITPNQQVLVIGFYRDWWIVQRGEEKLLVPDAALEIKPTDYTIASRRFIYPHHQIRTEYTSNIVSTPEQGSSNHDLYTGPRGGQYYINGNGNKTYVTPQSTIDRENVQTGPRGGQYYINGNGRKTYIKH